MTIEDATIMVIFGCFDLLIFLVMIYVAVSIIKWFFGLFSSGSGSYRLSQGASEPDTYDYDPEKERRNRQEQEAWEEKLDDDRLREEWEANQRRKLGYDDDD
ncbi:MAG: hypothetical protein HYU84_04820 [Chloroflexi bacterium]|nr:hypothetical protein [Chloroflexota bacterium]